MECIPVSCSSSIQPGEKEEMFRQQAKDSIRNPDLEPDKHPQDVQDALEFVIIGGMLTKVRSRKKQQQRFFRVDTLTLMLVYSDSTKNRFQNKSHDQSKVPISKIIEIREGMQSDVFRNVFRNDPDAPEISRCFTISILGERTLDLIAPDDRSYQLWLTGLKYLTQFLEESDPIKLRAIFLTNLFTKSDENGDGLLDLGDIQKVLESMNIVCDDDYAQQICQAAQEFTHRQESQKPKATPNCLTPSEFVAFCNLVERQEEVEEIFSKYDHGNGEISPEDISLFMTSEQNMQLSDEEILEIIQTYETCPQLRKKPVLSLTGFHALMRSKWMDIKSPSFQGVYQDMDQPLCHYFIDSSHNTYLEQDQLRGPSKVECYQKALQSGIRCIEIDVWDGNDGLPIVYHGYTLTSKISFRDVIEAVDKFAFESSEYPVIISIENHCSVSQQKIMAETMKSTFGSKFFTELPEDIKSLPSPNQLKGRIIAKGKKIPDLPGTDSVTELSDEDEADEVSPDDEQVKRESDKKTKGAKKKLAQELSDCIVICQNYKFKTFEDLKENTTFKEIKNFAEGKALNLIQTHFGEFLRSNTWQMTRIYPGGSRTNSSNYDPLPFWRAGCQIIALNSQTSDLPVQVNRAMFEDNGGAGYVLKPDFMRNSTFQDKLSTLVSHLPLFSSDNAKYSLDGPYPSQWRKILTIQIISAFQLPKRQNNTNDILDPFVKIHVFGVPSDSQEIRTEMIKNNGFHPIWNERFEFAINCPELAIILFRVFDNEDRKKDKVVAQYGLPMRCLGTGYRTIHLKTTDGHTLKAGTLFVHISIKADGD